MCFLCVAFCPQSARAEVSAEANAAFTRYVQTVELRIGQQHASAQQILVSSDALARARRGEMVIEELTPPNSSDIHGGMLHHWRGTAFVPGAKAADFERLLRDLPAYPHYFAPQVVRASVLGGSGDHMMTTLRVRQKHVITVVMDIDYDVRFGRLDAANGYSTSHSTRVAEIADENTSKEHALSPADEHGFLWRLNSYWSYAERDGGLYLQIEAVSLTRAVPHGLGWAVGPYVKSIPRESLEFTLQSARNALKR